MTNPADLCRECELLQKVQQLEAENAELKKIIEDWQARDQMRISGF